MAGLEIVGLTKAFGGETVVDDVSFEVAEGEFFVLLGPSGGGKTTVLRLICGLERPDAGRIAISGREVTGLPPRERDLAVVFQEYGLYPNMDVYGNIAYGLEARGTPREEVRRRVTEVAQVLGLGDMLRLGVVDLSGGEQQRVALARAMARDASAYLYDEPLSNLDPKLRHQARRNILEIHRRKRRPSLYVTHDQSEAIAVADRIGVISHGRLQQVGTAEDLLDRPANTFVARFIGTPPMNLLTGALHREDERYRVVSDGASVSLPRSWNPILDAYGKAQVILGIRPDAMRPDSSMRGEGVVTGEVANVEPLIGETLITLRLGGSEVLTAALEAGAEGFVAGEAVQLGVMTDGIGLFDAETGESLQPAPR